MGMTPRRAAAAGRAAAGAARRSWPACASRRWSRVGTATIAAAIGAGGLGEYIFRGIAMVDTTRSSWPAPCPRRCWRWPSTGLLVRVEQQPSAARAAAALLAAAVVAAAARRSRSPARRIARRATGAIVVGSKNFTEQVVLGEILAAGDRATGLAGRSPAEPRRHADLRRGGARPATSTSTSNTRAPRSPTILHRPVEQRPRRGVLRDVRDRLRAARPHGAARRSASTTRSRWSRGPTPHGASASGACPTWPRTRTPCASASSASSSSAPTACPASWPRTASGSPCRPRRWTSGSSTRAAGGPRGRRGGQRDRRPHRGQRPGRARGRSPLLPALRRRARREHGQPGRPSGDRKPRWPRWPAASTRRPCAARTWPWTARIARRRPWPASSCKRPRPRRAEGGLGARIIAAWPRPGSTTPPIRGHEGGIDAPCAGPRCRARDPGPAGGGRGDGGAVDRRVEGRARRSTATSSASSPSTSATASTRASGSARTPRSPTRAASATTSSPRSRRIKVPNVRWPGGCFADEYHWRNGIGPPNAPGDAQSELGRRDRAEHLRHARVHGLRRADRQPRPISRSTSGSGTPQEAAEWLEYLTDRPADDAGARSARPTAIPRRTRSPYPRPRQRELGLRRQHDAGLLRRAR